METAFSIVQYGVGGLIGLMALLFVLALIFGKRVRKQWEFDADFHNDDGREIGEFDIELSQVDKEETVDTLKATLRLRHKHLHTGAPVEVLLDGKTVMTGEVETEGRIQLNTRDLTVSHLEASTGQLCAVMSGGSELCSAELVPD